MKNPAAGGERGEANDFWFFRSGREHPHRLDKRYEGYGNKEEGGGHGAHVQAENLGDGQHSSGGALRHRKTLVVILLCRR